MIAHLFNTWIGPIDRFYITAFYYTFSTSVTRRSSNRYQCIKLWKRIDVWLGMSNMAPCSFTVMMNAEWAVQSLLLIEHIVKYGNDVKWVGCCILNHGWTWQGVDLSTPPPLTTPHTHPWTNIAWRYRRHAVGIMKTSMVPNALSNTSMLLLYGLEAPLAMRLIQWLSNLAVCSDKSTVF